MPSPSPDAPRCDVVIPTWNAAHRLLPCLQAFAAQGAGQRLVVVDNGSTDGTVDLVRRELPDALVVSLPENLGFGRAVWAGVQACDAPVVVVTNNDVLPEPDFLATLIAPLEVRGGPGSTAGVLLDAAGTAVDSAGIVLDGGLAGFSHLHGAATAVLDAPVTEPLGACGGAAAYRREVLVGLGGYDPEIFAYSEDVDLALRLHAAGVSSRLVPLARARHLGSATLGARTPAQLRLSGFGRGYVLGRYRVAARWVLLELAVGLVDAVLQRHPAPLAARWAGLRAGRRLPRRRPSAGAAQVSARDSLRRRYRAARPVTSA